MYLDNILIYINDNKNDYVIAIWCVLKQLKKVLLYANLKKCQFYKKELWFLNYVVSSESIYMEDKKIKVFKQWLELKSVPDIQVFLRFANFYQQFIYGIRRKAALLTSMLKISSTKSAEPKKSGVRVGGDNRARHDSRCKLEKSEISNNEYNDEVDDEVKKKGQKMSKFKNLFKSKELSKSKKR